MFMLLSVIVAAFCLLGTAYGAIPDHLITSLPGYPNGGKTPTPQYSGYLAVANDRWLHYWMVYSENNPSTDPLILWMNGGPGCSSLEGFLFEQGPVRFTGLAGSDGVPLLEDNPWRWNLFANMVFLEAPVGVGYSYTTDPSWANDDNTTAVDNFAFLQQFFKGFPEFAANEFFITGESYAGVYTITLADQVRVNNANGNSKINIKGVSHGNGCIGNAVGSCSGGNQPLYISTMNIHLHQLISSAMWADIASNCTDWNNPSDQCMNLENEAQSIASIANVYDIYDDCQNGEIYIAGCNQTALPPNTRPAKRTSARYYSSRIPAPRALKAISRVKPLADHACDDVDPSQYLNPQSVRNALHVANESVTGPFQSGMCFGINYNANIPSLLPGYSKIIEAMRVMIYSGDADDCVPTWGTQEWISSLGYPIQTAWQPWTVDDQVGGYYVEYEVPNNSQFRFNTIKMAGHMVPQYKPVEAYAMMQAFVTNQPPKHLKTPFGDSKRRK